MGGIFISGFEMPDDGLFGVTAKQWRVILGLNVISGIIRMTIGIIGIWLVYKLKELIIIDQINRRPDGYTQYEFVINIWNFCNLWSPVILTPLLSISILFWLMILAGDTSSDYYTRFQPSNGDCNTALNLECLDSVQIFLMLWLSGVLFVAPIIDSGMCLFFYSEFKEFIEATFQSHLYACNWRCRGDLDLSDDVRRPCC